MGTTMAGIVRAAAKEKARALLEQERRITLSPQDFAAVAAALESAFAANKALRAAIQRTHEAVRALARRARNARMKRAAYVRMLIREEPFVTGADVLGDAPRRMGDLRLRVSRTDFGAKLARRQGSVSRELDVTRV